ncbi:MAG: hypothetical protein RID07_05380, partial [Lacipirellulaceae bacterium]
MSRASRANHESDDGMPGEDSFLDIVANIVGILIILVMVVGVRASQGSLMASPEEETPEEQTQLHEVTYEPTPPPQEIQPKAEPEPDETQSEAEELAQIRREIAFASRKNAEQARRTIAVARERKLLEAERQKLVEMQSLHEQDLAARRARLDEKSQEEFDVQRELLKAKIELKKLTEQQYSLVGQTEESEEIVCMPTPLAREVKEAIIVRLRHGKLGVIPYDELKQEMQRLRKPYLTQGVMQRGHAVDTVGPIDGFRFRLYLERKVEVPITVSPVLAGNNVKVQMVGAILPVNEEVGQPIEQALLPNSKFKKRLRNRSSNHESVLAFIYPDAYNDVRL